MCECRVRVLEHGPRARPIILLASHSHHDATSNDRGLFFLSSFPPSFATMHNPRSIFSFLLRDDDDGEEEEVEEKLRVISLSLGSRGEAMCTPSKR